MSGTTVSGTTASGTSASGSTSGTTSCGTASSGTTASSTTASETSTSGTSATGASTSTGSPSSASSHSSSSTSSTGTSTTASAAPACTDFWLEKIAHQGVAPFAGSGYSVFRNVKAYGAKGDGVTDDTDAINRAISDGDRCGPGCTGSTKTPGLVYFPPGTYMVSAPIIDFYYTQLIGNPGCPPVLKATSDFNGRWLLDTNPYQPSGSLAWGATNVFWRQVANFVVDITSVDARTQIAGIHWPSSQATSLQNIVFKMSRASDTQHQGLFIEEGSGGYMGDLVFYGGAQAMAIGNQQFTMRNITIHNAKTAVQQLWSWGWTYKGLSINNCELGFDFTAVSAAGRLGVGSITLLDSHITNTSVGVAFGSAGVADPPVANNLILENIHLDNVPTAIRDPAGTVLQGSSGTTVIDAWGRGHKYTTKSTGPTTFQGAIRPNARPHSLTLGGGGGGTGAFYERSKPQYADAPLSEFASARAAGARGDGVTDDSDALNALLAAAAAARKIVFLDAGMYLVTKTVRIPPGSRIVGEAYPVILSSGAFFADAANPRPVVQVGSPGGSVGRIEWSNTILSTQGAQPGAILLEYNLATPPPSSSSSCPPSGIWDVHVRLGGFAGSNLQLSHCPTTPNTTLTAANFPRSCVAAFLSVHLTRTASNLYLENSWVWVADHDLEPPAANAQISVFAGRGLLVDRSAGPLWLVGSSVEHHQLYEYQLVGARDVFLGQAQTETAYYQPNPRAGSGLPFAADPRYHDPVFKDDDDEGSGWGLRVVDSQDVLVYGAGLYSFFDNYNVSCSQEGNGEACQARTFSVEGASKVRVYNLNTVGTNRMITVDGVDVAGYADNADGFVQTVALFEADVEGGK